MSSRYLPLVLLSFAGIFGAEPKRDRFGDSLPEGAVARLGSLCLRPEQPVFAGAFTPDGKYLVTGGGMVTGKGTITFWDVVTGKEARRLQVTLPFRVHGICFRADGKSLILVGNSGGFRILDAATGTEQRKLDSPGENAFLAVDVARDGKTAVTTGFRGNIIVWDLARGERLREFKIPRKLLFWFDRTPFNPITALTPDGKQLVLPQLDGALHLVDVASGKKVVDYDVPRRRPGEPPELQIVAVSPDGRYLSYGNRWTPATLCDLQTGKRRYTLTSPKRSIFGLLFTPDSRALAVQNHGVMRFFDTESGKEVRKLAKSSGVGYPLALSPDGKILALLEAEHAISLWDAGTGRQMHSTVRHKSLVQSIVFFPDGKRLVSSDASGNLIVWDIASAQVLAHHENSHNKPRGALSVDEDGKTVRFLSFDYLLRCWDPTAGREASRQKLPQTDLNDWILSPDGRTLAATIMATPITQVLLRDLQGGKAARTIEFPKDVRIGNLLFSPDSRLLLVGASDNALRFWDRDTGKLMRELKAGDPRNGPGYWTFASDGRSLAYFDYALGYHLGIREIASGGVRLRVPLKHGGNPLVYSRDGRFVACACSTGGILVLGTATGKEVARWQGPHESVYSLAFNPDSRLLASGFGDGTILLWKTPDGEGLSAKLTPEEAGEFWQSLASDDAAHANRALAGLAAAPAQAVPLINERFPRVWKKPDAKQVARWIAELDDDAFKVRERAARELAEAGPDAIEALRAALAASPSVEAKKSIEGLLQRADKGGAPEYLRALRAVEVLERIGTPPAREVLRELSRQPLTVELQKEIEASLRRLKGRGQAEPGRPRTP